MSQLLIETVLLHLHVVSPDSPLASSTYGNWAKISEYQNVNNNVQQICTCPVVQVVGVLSECVSLLTNGVTGALDTLRLLREALL